MDNDKRCTLTVEVPRKRPELKDTIKDALREALRKGLIEAGNSLIGRLSRDEDDSGTELTIDIPKIEFIDPQDETIIAGSLGSGTEETEELE